MAHSNTLLRTLGDGKVIVLPRVLEMRIAYWTKDLVLADKIELGAIFVGVDSKHRVKQSDEVCS